MKDQKLDKDGKPKEEVPEKSPEEKREEWLKSLCTSRDQILQVLGVEK